MPRLKCTFGEFIEIIERHGFELVRHDGTSHRRYRRVVGGRVYLVTVAAHNMRDDIKKATLDSMIRQSGLPKWLFRK